MNEASVRKEVYGTMRAYRYWPIRGRDATVCPSCHTQILPPIGRPDILVLHPNGVNRVIEVKTVNMEVAKSFAFSEISQEQRKWLTRWRDEGGLGYLAIGTVNIRPRKLWIVDWTAWLNFEEMILEWQMSIPIDMSTGQFKVALRERSLDLTTLGQSFEFSKQKRIWKAPPKHTLLDEWSTLHDVSRGIRRST